MEKGKIIWILYNNCLYCSEISEVCILKIGWTDGRVEEKTHIDLVPIVGDINKIMTLQKINMIQKLFYSFYTLLQFLI